MPKGRKKNNNSTIYERTSSEEDLTVYKGMVKDLREALEVCNSTIKELKSNLQRQTEIPTTVAGNNCSFNEGEMQARTDSEILRRETSTFSFKDVEESLNSFNGQDNYLVTKFISDFESAAEVLRWNEMQKVVYAKRLLKGAARLATRCVNDLNSWTNLKKFLLEEFSISECSAEVHHRLRLRRKLPSETCYEYFLIMRELGSRVNLDLESIIKYTIDGIPYDENSKVILYGATNISEFRDKLKVCEQIYHNKIKTKERDFSVKNKYNQSSRKRSRSFCFLCGKEDHLARVCPQRKNGPKCFSCNEFGHKSMECPKKQKPSSSIALMKDETPSNLGDMTKIVLLNNVSVRVFVDTGSDLSLVREDGYERLQRPLLSKPTNFYGVGSEKLSTLGSFKACLKIDGHEFTETFHVVSNDILPWQFILGKPFLKSVELKVIQGIIEIQPAKFEPYLMCMHVSQEDVPALSYISSEDYRRKVEEMIKNYQPKKDVTTSEYRMKILLKDDTPIWQPPRRLSPSEREIVDLQVEEWLKEGIVTPSSSEFASPVVVVNKKDGSKRICVDYRRVNKVLIKDHQPLPLIEDQVDKLATVKVFSTLDLRNGFFHVHLHEDSKRYTSFVTHFGQFEFTRAPFGLSTSPTNFQRYVNSIFRNLIRANKVLVYVDDIIVLSKDYEEGLDRLSEVLHVAANHGLEIKWKKCRFLQRDIEYLGYKISEGKVSPSEEKIKALTNFPEPRTMKQIQSFLGLTGFFRKFIKDYAIIAKPLSDLLRKNSSFEFSKIQRQAFNQLKQALCSSPVLALYNPKAVTELHTDASSIGYGAILLQRNSEDECFHPVYYLSRKTTPTEEKYSSYMLEVLAIVTALKKFRVYLLGLKFKLVTDCAAFACTLQKKEMVPKVARWAMLLEEFDYTIEHRSGGRMKHVDALSRNPVVLTVQEEDGLIQKMKREQGKDEKIRAILKILENEEFESYFNDGGILYKIKDDEKLLVVPKSFQKELIRIIHNQGHFGVKKNEVVISKDYFIPNLRRRIEECIASCVPCILSNKEGRKEGFLHVIPKESIPLYTYHIDHLGPITRTRKGYQYILTIVDAFTKFVWIYPTKTTTTKEVLQKLEIQKITFGNPARIISDRGTAFTSSSFEEYCAKEGIKHIKITTGVPRGNGQVERIHRIIIAMLTKMSLEDEVNWYKHVGRIQRILNSTYQRSIATTPFELLTGTKMKNTEDVVLAELLDQELVSEFVRDRDESRKAAAVQIAKVQEENRKGYNKRRKPSSKYRIGDLVAIRRTQFGSGLKIRPKYLGPYKVTKVKLNDRYDVEKMGEHEGPRCTSTAADLMRLYVDFEEDDDEDIEEDYNDDSDKDIEEDYNDVSKEKSEDRTQDEIH